MANIVIILILLILVGMAAAYIVKEKKKGTQCIGCPYSATCAKQHCGGEQKKKS